MRLSRSFRLFTVFAMLEPDRDQIEIFVDAIFRRAAPETFASVRSFYEGNDKPFVINAIPCDLRFLTDVALDIAGRAANEARPVVFCPPLATFTNKK
jgi:hypothetical protein